MAKKQRKAIDGAADVEQVAEVLRLRGDMFHGGRVEEIAAEWVGEGFDAAGTARWCDVGVWDAGVAARLHAAAVTPQEAEAAADVLVERDGAQRYSYGDPIYAACNCDIDVDVLIAAAKGK